MREGLREVRGIDVGASGCPGWVWRCKMGAHILKKGDVCPCWGGMLRLVLGVLGEQGSEDERIWVGFWVGADGGVGSAGCMVELGRVQGRGEDIRWVLAGGGWGVAVAGCREVSITVILGSE